MRRETVASSRLVTLGVVLGLGFLALLVRLWALQVLSGDRYADLAEDTRVRTARLVAPRGRILAADGSVLVGNRPAHVVAVDRPVLLDAAGEPRDPAARAVLRDLAGLLGTTFDELLDRATTPAADPLAPVPVAEDVPVETVLRIEERRDRLPGVVTVTRTVRDHPRGDLAAHLVGTVREIGEDELATPAHAERRAGDHIGVGGLEETYDHVLRGTDGLRRVEVTPTGRVRAVVDELAPRPGHDLVTTIDADLQRATRDALRAGLATARQDVHRDSGRPIAATAGAAVVLDPRSGAVLAMVSEPSFDPAAFVGGLSHADFARIFDAEEGVDHHEPILNRAVQGVYPPGSTWKIVSGTAGLTTGVIEPRTLLDCPARWRWGKRNWNDVDEGPMDLATALMRSCDPFFYELGWRHWQADEAAVAAGRPATEPVQAAARRFGFGAPTGIDVPDERSGRVPDRAWRAAWWDANRDELCARADAARRGTDAAVLYAELCVDGGRWRGGDAANLAIGQGDVLVTPLQVAAAFAAVGNRGTVWRPHVAAEVRGRAGQVVARTEPRAAARLGLDTATLAPLREGLTRVVADPRGTAHGAFTAGAEPFPLDLLPVAGKTGTAEVSGALPTAWFAGYAPAHDPDVAVVVVVEEGGGGSQTAAPIARRILEAALVTDADGDTGGSGGGWNDADRRGVGRDA